MVELERTPALRPTPLCRPATGACGVMPRRACLQAGLRAMLSSLPTGAHTCPCGLAGNTPVQSPSRYRCHRRRWSHTGAGTAARLRGVAGISPPLVGIDLTGADGP
jgi:hypothetical protein